MQKFNPTPRQVDRAIKAHRDSAKLGLQTIVDKGYPSDEDIANALTPDVLLALQEQRLSYNLAKKTLREELGVYKNIKLWEEPADYFGETFESYYEIYSKENALYHPIKEANYATLVSDFDIVDADQYFFQHYSRPTTSILIHKDRAKLLSKLDDTLDKLTAEDSVLDQKAFDAIINKNTEDAIAEIKEDLIRDPETDFWPGITKDSSDVDIEAYAKHISSIYEKG